MLQGTEPSRTLRSRKACGWRGEGGRAVRSTDLSLPLPQPPRGSGGRRLACLMAGGTRKKERASEGERRAKATPCFCCCCCCCCELPVPSHCFNPFFDLSLPGASSNQSMLPASCIGRRESADLVVQRDTKRLRNSELPRNAAAAQKAKSLPPLQLGVQVFPLFVAGASASHNTKERPGTERET